MNKLILFSYMAVICFGGKYLWAGMPSCDDSFKIVLANLEEYIANPIPDRYAKYIFINEKLGNIDSFDQEMIVNFGHMKGDNIYERQVGLLKKMGLSENDIEILVEGNILKSDPLETRYLTTQPLAPLGSIISGAVVSRADRDNILTNVVIDAIDAQGVFVRELGHGNNTVEEILHRDAIYRPIQKGRDVVYIDRQQGYVRLSKINDVEGNEFFLDDYSWIDAKELALRPRGEIEIPSSKTPSNNRIILDSRISASGVGEIDVLRNLQTRMREQGVSTSIEWSQRESWSLRINGVHPEGLQTFKRYVETAEKFGIEKVFVMSRPSSLESFELSFEETESILSGINTTEFSILHKFAYFIDDHGPLLLNYRNLLHLGEISSLAFHLRSFLRGIEQLSEEMRTEAFRVLKNDAQMLYDISDHLRVISAGMIVSRLVEEEAFFKRIGKWRVNFGSILSNNSVIIEDMEGREFLLKLPRGVSFADKEQFMNHIKDILIGIEGFASEVRKRAKKIGVLTSAGPHNFSQADFTKLRGQVEELVIFVQVEADKSQELF